MTDTCSGSVTYKRDYAKHWFGIWFTNYVISLPAAHQIQFEVSWTAIDTAYYALSSIFAAMEVKIWYITFKKMIRLKLIQCRFNHIYGLRLKDM